MKKGFLINKGSISEINDAVKNKVWKLSVSEKEHYEYENKYLISNTKPDNNGNVELRIISDEKPNNQATTIKSELEDAYLYYINKS